MSKRKRNATDRKAVSAWLVWVPSLSVLVGVVALIAAQGLQAADVVVYKSPTCGCCGKWVDHMQAAGITVDVQNRRDLRPIKAELGVPSRLQSCHTAKVGDYLVEGHVPADLVQRLLDEKPDIKGLAVPGMPMGSPGMEGPYKDEYDVLAIGKDGRTKVYARR